MSAAVENNSPNGGEKVKEYSPYDQEIINTVISIWKKNPATENLGNAKLLLLIKRDNPSWSLSEKRLKNLLKQRGLQTNVPPVQYVSETVSYATPELELPPGVRLELTKARGKALYAARSFKEGDLIWEEEPLIMVAPLDVIPLMRKTLACAHCAKPFQQRSKSDGIPRGGSDCKNCPARWCTPKCRKSDIIHAALWHQSANTKIKDDIWQKFENYCLENEWNAAYGYGIVLLNTLKDISKGKLRQKIDSMAKVRQDVRQKALDPPQGQQQQDLFGGGLLQEQYEELWNEGYKLLRDTVSPSYELSYDEFMYGVGMFNINNLDGNIFLTQSHLNHACDPNVDVKVVGRTTGIKVYAKRDIRNGEELLTTYVNPSDPLSKRRFDLRVNWGFLCNCKRCKEEDKEATEAAEAQLSGLSIETPIADKTRRKSVRFDEKPDLG